MEKRVSGWNRFLALLLVFALVLGFMPASTKANDGQSGQTSADATLRGEIVREEHVLPGGSTEKTEPSEEESDQRTEAPVPQTDEDVVCGTVKILNADGTVCDAGKVEGNTVTVVTPDATVYQWYDQDGVHPKAGWYMGIRVTAPEGMTGEAHFTDGEKKVIAKTRGTGEWSDPFSFWEEQNSDKAAQDTARYVDAWYYLDVARLYTAKEKGLDYGFAVDWNKDGTCEQEIKLVVDPAKITLMKGEKTAYPVPCGTVSILNGDGSVSDNGTVTGTDEVTVDPGVTTYQWFPAEGDRPKDGWYVGVRLAAPAGMTKKADLVGEQKQAMIKTRGTGDWSEGISFWENQNSDSSAEDTQRYIDVWFYLDASRLYTAKMEDGLTYGIKADWDQDGWYEQVVTLVIDPADVTLRNEAGDGDVYPVTDSGSVSVLNSDGTINSEGSITGNKSDIVTVTPGKTTYYWLAASEDAGRSKDGYWAGIRIDLPAKWSKEKAQYQLRKSGGQWSEAATVVDALESDGDSDYITLWKSLNALASGDELPATQMQLDWNGDGAYDQCVTFNVDPDKVTLMKGDKQEYPFVKYTYVVNVYENDELVEEGVEISWKDASDETLTGNGNVLNTDVASVCAVAVYNGVALTLKSNSNGTNTVTVAAPSDPWVDALVVGVPFDLPTDGLADGAELTREGSYTEEHKITDGELKEQDGKYHAEKPGTVTVTQQWAGADGTVYAVRELSAKVQYPEAVIETDPEPNDAGWYTEVTKVTVTVSGVEGLVSNDLLPKVTGGEWTGEGDTRQVIIEDIDTSTTVTYGAGTDVEKKLELKVDTKTPVVSIEKNYWNDDEQTVVFSYEVGESGLASAKVGSNTVDIGEDPEQTGKFTVTLTEGQDPTQVVITNGAGVSANAEGAIQPDLKVTITEVDASEIIGKVDDVHYLPKDNDLKLTVTIDGIGDGYEIEELTIVAKDQDGKDIDVPKDKTTFQVPLSNGLKELKVSVKDTVGRTAEAKAKKAYGVDKTAPEIDAPALDGILNGAVVVDDVLYLRAKATFNFQITDLLPERYANGKSELTYKLNGQKKTAKFNSEGKASITLEDGDKLSDVTVTAYDLTGNEAGKNFISPNTTVIVDATDPKIELWLSEDVSMLFSNDKGNFAVVDPSCDSITVYAKITDEDLDTAAVETFMKAARWSLSDGVWSKTLQVDALATGTMTFSFMARDLAGRYAQNSVDLRLGKTGEGADPANVLAVEPVKGTGDEYTYSFELKLDRRAPGSTKDGELQILLSPDPVYDGIYKSDKLEITISDASAAGNDSGIKGTPVVEVDNGLVKDVQDNGDGTYTVVLTDPTEDGTEASDVKVVVSVEDNVGNTVTYTKTFALDNQKPRIEITQSESPDNIFEETEYYRNEVTYTVVVTDLYLDDVTVGYTVNGEERSAVAQDGVATITVKNGEILTNISVKADDLVGNEISESHDYSVIVDTVDPTAKLSFSSNVKEFKIGDDGTVFVVLKEAVKGESGKASTMDNQTVTVTLEVTDLNLSLKRGITANAEHDFAWTGTPERNSESTVTFEATSGEVQPDGTCVFTIDVGVKDLAGNTLKTFVSEKTSENDTVLVSVEEDGSFGFDVSVDRRRPASSEDAEQTPTLVVTPSIEPTKTEDGKDLFNGAFEFTVDITDGAAGKNNSGISKVEWSLTDANGVVADASGSGTTAGKYTIPVDLAVAKGESNVVTLQITAVDKVGNTVTFEQVFGVDTLKPRVTIEQSNTVVTNDVFFDAEQKITVTIEDLNFDPSHSSVTTEVAFGGWEKVANKEDTYQTVLTYDQDGDYTFGMQTTDLANNAADIDLDTDLVALREFVVDKTAPEVKVQVTYQDDTANTVNGIDYYSDKVTFDITVTDVNLKQFKNYPNTAVAYVTYKLADSDWKTIDLVDELKGDDRTAQTATATITIEDGQMLTDLQIVVKDNADNIPKPIEGFTYDQNNAVWVYDSNDIVVDMTDPTAELRFSENVKDFYVVDSTVYVVLYAPVVGTSAADTGLAPETVEVYFKTTDLNLMLGDAAVSGDHNWIGEPAVNTQSTLEFTLVSDAVDADGTHVFAVELGVVDLAGNTLKTFAADPTLDGQTLIIEAVDGQIDFDVSVDRRRPTSDVPDAAAPSIIVTPSIQPTSTSDGKDLFDGDFEFTVKVTDGEDSMFNSGVDNVIWTLTDANGVVLKKDNGAGAVSTNGMYTIPVAVDPALTEGGESNEVTLTITAVDHVGNTITYEKVFGVDTLRPRVSIQQSNQDVENGIYFDKDQVVTVTIEDLNFEPTTSSVTTEVAFGGWKNVATDTYQTVLTYDKDGDYTFAMQTTDRANNAAVIDYVTGQVSLTEFVLDKTAPVVDVDYIYIDDVPVTLDGIDYYEDQVKINIKVTDVNLDAFKDYASGAVAYVEYKMAEGKWQRVELLELLQGDARTPKTAETTITVNNEDVLTDLQIVVVDNAGNKPVAIDGFAFDEKASKWTYTGNDIAVDTEAPVIRVAKTYGDGAKYVQTHQGVDYHNGEITYTVTIEDKFLLKGAGAAQLVIYYQDKTETVDLFAGMVDKGDTRDHYTYSFTVHDGEMVLGMTLQIVDNAGNVIDETASNLSTGDAYSRTTFAYDEVDGLWNYTGNASVVDATRPTASLTFSENVVGCYIVGDVVYAILKAPVIGESGEATGMADETVTVTIKATDLNLALGNGVLANADHGFAWTGTPAVNGESTVTFVASSSAVKADGTRVFVIDVNVTDLAGNHLQNFVTDLRSENVAVEIGVDEGKIQFQTSVDRQRPSSEAVNDTSAPTITIRPSVEPNKTSDAQGALDLFSGAFDFYLNVTDGAVGNKNSGVKYVRWTITDANGVVVAVDSGERISTNGDYVIDVDLAQRLGESNAVTLNIVAVDNVGNTITFEKIFGVDTLAPRVTIQQSNHSAQNEKYFKEDQIITVTIEDLNFEPTTSAVTTEVPFSGWQNVGGNSYQTVLTYNTDGDYTFEMGTTDRALNASVIDYITGQVALQSFTIDKTAPVIDVRYSQELPVDTDPDGVQYFDADRTVTVTITEHNFNAADVVSDLGSANFLSAWGSQGDVRTASSTFVEGNRYHVSVAYTDLAGNPAVAYSSPVFSVDKTVPEIVMTSGDMQFGTLNIVPGNLNLGFTVTDPQANLKNIDVELVFTDRGFKQVVTENYYTVQYQDDRVTGFVTFSDIPSDRATDGIYTLRITAHDFAGHAVPLQSDLVFSVNRHGSTFLTEDAATKDFLTAGASGVIYHNSVDQDLVIKEINPNRVWQDAEHSEEGSVITVSANGNAKKLVKGEDYEVATEEMGNGSNKWYEYTYTIKKDVFYSGSELVDGDYTIYFYSEDEAANKNSNETNEGSQLQLGADGTYAGKISFTLDHQKPVVTILGIEDGKNYWEENRTVQIDIADNAPVTIEVYVNGVLVELVDTADGKTPTSDWIVLNKNTGKYELNLSQKNDEQTVTVKVVDAAGNDREVSVKDVMLNESFWYQYISEPVALILTGVLLLALIILIILLVSKRKKKAEQAANTTAPAQKA